MLLGAFNKEYEKIIRCANELIGETGESCLRKMKEFCGVCSSVYYLDRWVWASFFAAQDDVFYKPVDHPDVQQVQAVTTDVSLGDDATVYNDVTTNLHVIKTFLASASRTGNGKQPFSNSMLLKLGAFLSVYFLRPFRRDRQFRFYAGNPCFDLFRQALDIPSKIVFKRMYEQILPTVTMMKIIRVPKLD